MSQDDSKGKDGSPGVLHGLHEGPARTSPYPMSRLAPRHDLVDAAMEIVKADTLLGTVTESKLKVILDQIRSLQNQARTILEKAERDSVLHRAKCSFEKQPGKVYHLYERHDGERYFSMLAPHEWSLPQPQTFLGSYRLELDMSWTPEGETEDVDSDLQLVRQLLAPKGT